MNKPFLILVLFSLFIVLETYGQDVEILDEQVGSEMILYAKNLTGNQYEINVTLNTEGFVTQDKSPIVRTLKGDSTILLTRLRCPDGTPCSYGTRLSYKKAMTTTAPGGQGTKKQRTTAVQINNNKINVFSKEGCPRCEFVINYLETNKIPYTELNMTLHQPNNELMFDKLQEAGFKDNTVQLPVIIYKDNISYNIKDLKTFVKTLNN